jgi:LysR family positive regulator for ilvC
MEISSLDTFVKTAQLLHFGRASRACNLSPSALTRTIQRLEEEVGQPLFLRDNRRVVLTDAGKQFLSYARSTLQEWHHFRVSLSSEGRIAGPLSLYASITAVYGLLPDLLEAYRSAYPEVHLELQTGAAERAVEQVLNGGIDLAVAALPDQKPPGLEFMLLAETPLVFITSKSHDLLPTGKTEPLNLSRIPMVLPRSGVARHRLDLWARRHHVIPKISTEVSGNEALIAMVRLGAGIGIVPQLVLDRSPFRCDVTVLTNAPVLDSYAVGLCASKRSLKQPAVKAMWELAEKI